MKCLLGLICFLIGMPVSAWAHRVIVFAWPQAGQVHVEAKFSGGRPAIQAAVDVFDENGTKRLSGKTDDAGTFTFAQPSQGGLKIVVNAGTGHRGEWLLSAADLGQPDLPAAAAVDQPATPTPPSEAPAPQLAASGDALERFAALLDRKLNPIQRELTHLRHPGPSLQDIFGGIGYILGLVGLATYLRYRQKLKLLDRDH